MSTKTYAIAIRDVLAEEMRRDPDVFLMGEDIAQQGGIFGCTRGLVDEFGPERVRNTPISENTFVGAGVGAASVGMRPVVELMYMDFLYLAMDQILNQAAKMRYMFGGKVKVPLVIRGQQGIGRGNAGQHSQSVEGLLMNIPGLKVVCPSSPADAAGLLRTAIRDDNPVVFIEHKALYAVKGEVPDDPEFAVPFGKCNIVREGKDVTIVGNFLYLGKALEAAEHLAKEGISAEVIDPRTLVPLDIDTIAGSVKKTGR
jgi:pyruvate dehydrogenase E1 component beta subunit